VIRGMGEVVAKEIMGAFCLSASCLVMGMIAGMLLAVILL
jgi:hypothetical protein